MTTICYAWDPNLNVCIGGEQTNQQTRTKSQSAGHELREAQQHECTQLWPPSKLITDCCWDPINSPNPDPEPNALELHSGLPHPPPPDPFTDKSDVY